MKTEGFLGCWGSSGSFSVSRSRVRATFWGLLGIPFFSSGVRGEGRVIPVTHACDSRAQCREFPTVKKTALLQPRVQAQRINSRNVLSYYSLSSYTCQVELSPLGGLSHCHCFTRKLRLRGVK